MRVVYTGPSPAVEPARGIRAERGEPVNVPPKLARALLKQRTWQRPPKKGRPNEQDPGGSLGRNDDEGVEGHGSDDGT